MDMLTLAQEYLDWGWSVFPVSIDKRPLIPWKEYQSRLPTPDEVEDWWTRWPHANVGIATGPVSGLAVVDLDSPEAEALMADKGGIPESAGIAITGRVGGGRHVYYAWRADAPTVFAKANGLDFRGKGGYAVAPGSTHKTGAVYTWERMPGSPLPPLPLWIDEYAGQGATGERAFVDVVNILEGVPDGQRDVTLFKFAAKLRRTDIPYAYAASLVQHAAEASDPPFENWREKLDQAYKYAPNPDASNVVVVDETTGAATDLALFTLTDTGNAYRLIHHFGRDFRYVKAWKQWLTWDGRRWSKDSEAPIIEMAKKTAMLIWDEAAAVADDTRRQAMAKHWSASLSERGIKAMVNLAKTDPRVMISPERLDIDPMLFNVRNGTLDLRTGELRDHDRADLITRLSDVDYDPLATAPRFMAFLNRIMDGSAELIDFHQKAIGYTLTGNVAERCMFVQHGFGSNGKSTLLEAMRVIFGEYAAIVPQDALMSKHSDSSIPNDIAKLAGARFAAASESDDGKRMAEAKIKSLTGNETITARFLYGEFFEFKPQFKIWFATNHKPEIRGTDNAIWNRIRLLPYTVSIPKEQQDSKLAEKLSNEAAGILAWAVEGCLRWQRDGLGVPQAVQDATSTYRSEMDSLGDFLDGLARGEGLRIEVKILYKMYQEWAHDMGERNPMTNRRLSNRLKERAGLSDYRSAGSHFWKGIGAPNPRSRVLDVDAVWSGDKIVE